MAAPQRISSSLWPTISIWRSREIYSPVVRSARAAAFRSYHSTRRRGQEQRIAQRYGTANEPPPHLGGGKGGAPSATKPAGGQQAKALPKIGEKLQRDGEKEAPAEEQGGEQRKKDGTIVEGKSTSQMTEPVLDSREAAPIAVPPGSLDMPEDKPMESVLNTVPSPDQQRDENTKDEPQAEEQQDKTSDEHSPPIKAPHIDQPLYVHHFDTYGLVKRLVGDGGWNQEQAITAMKAMRLMLADNTNLAKEALVSKSQLENEAYLFKAACAELKTEVTTRRKSEQEKMRTERTQLQHEVDILSQRLGQESAALKDDLKGMFDDRKMAVRNEQRNMESKLQQLNYKITVSLQADAKTEVEGLRWVMTRRVIITLGSIVLMIVTSLKLASNASKEAEETTKKRSKSATVAKAPALAEETAEDVANRLGNGEVVVVKEGDAGFVSLG